MAARVQIVDLTRPPATLREKAMHGVWVRIIQMEPSEPGPRMGLLYRAAASGGGNQEASPSAPLLMSQLTRSRLWTIGAGMNSSRW
jgi:hypothetical protein